GTRVRKMHSSYRSTFRTIGDIPLAMVDRKKITPLRQDYHKRRNDKSVIINTAFEEKVAIVYYYPNMQPDIIYSLIDNDYKGIVIAGTGLGHVNKPLYPALKKAQEKNESPYKEVLTKRSERLMPGVPFRVPIYDIRYTIYVYYIHFTVASSLAVRRRRRACRTT
ncbi:MAG TPA: hypothetical protein PKM08_11510, partial [Syntrophorhabdaceae bacterium]|nr:hypothetical protein [Syntrophorhabdaceae bacterium]